MYIFIRPQIPLLHVSNVKKTVSSTLNGFGRLSFTIILLPLVFPGKSMQRTSHWLLHNDLRRVPLFSSTVLVSYNPTSLYVSTKIRLLDWPIRTFPSHRVCKYAGFHITCSYRSYWRVLWLNLIHDILLFDFDKPTSCVTFYYDSWCLLWVVH